MGTAVAALGAVIGGVTTGGLADVALGASALGAAASAVGSYEQGRAASNAANYQAQVARNNQVIADQNASFALQQGQQQVAAKQQQTAQTISDQRAITAASGIDPNRGSSVRIQGDTAALGALDAATISNNAARTAWGYQTQAGDFGAQASLLQSQASSATASGELGAFSSIIGGASSVANKWLTYNQQGVF
jgi:hypothetical protein